MIRDHHRAYAVLAALAAAALGIQNATPARAFCGFYVAESNAKLFNHASQVVIARDGDHTVLTLANDYEGDPKQFALVVPVPVVLSKEQVHVGNPAWIDHLDAYSAPRLVDYPDPEPCPTIVLAAPSASMGAVNRSIAGGRRDELEKDEKVTVEAAFSVDEYDIVILSATESRGLLAWLVQNGYHVPPQAGRALGACIGQGLKFFVARVNLEKRAALGVQKLRPLQMAYDSPRFMLPIRLGMVNARGPQELTVYTITPRGRVEPTNYRMVKAPTGQEVPLYVKTRFADFARAVFDHAVAKEGMRTVFLEYAWNAGWCDPCASAPVPQDELQQLGAAWLADGRGAAFVTRLHARYDRASFPEDLSFEETANAESFQARYVLRTPSHGNCNCPAGAEYRKSLAARHEAQRASLVALTGWSDDRVRTAMAVGDDAWLPAAPTQAAAPHWWDRVWKR